MKYLETTGLNCKTFPAKGERTGRSFDAVSLEEMIDSPKQSCRSPGQAVAGFSDCYFRV